MATELIRGFYNLKPHDKGVVATIGNFDGVHRGHQALITRLKEKATSLNVPSLVITFEPQPLEFLVPQQTVPRLTRFREKFYQLSQMGVDKVLVIRFNSQFAALTAEEFIDLILVKHLGLKHLIVGEDFHFGHARKGDVNFLTTQSQHLGFTVEIMPSILFQGEKISSTRIRHALQKGEQHLVENMLGRPYSIMGRIVYGNQRGRELGFPTANIQLHRKITPIHGIYVVRLFGLTQHGLPGVASVGKRPTVGGNDDLLEVHLFNFNQTIYGHYVAVEFYQKLRDEAHYANLDLLKEQISQDAELARDYFKNKGENV